MGESILIFLVFLTPLIFFHELGHFLFARLFGVRVEVFSIGFGPKIFKKVKGDTEYAVSIIPLGGYIKMFGDDPLAKDDVPQDLREMAFTHKTKWQRFWIVFGGPLANFLLAFVIFWGLFFFGEKVPELKLAQVTKASPLYDWGLRSGDLIEKVNFQEVRGPTDFAVKLEGKKIENLTVQRLGASITLDLEGVDAVTGEDFFKHFGNLKSPLRLPVMVDVQQKEYFVSLLPNLTEVSDFSQAMSLEELALFNKDSNTTFYLYQIAESKESAFKLTYLQTITSSEFAETENDFITHMRNRQYFPADLAVKSLQSDAPAIKAGLEAADVIYQLNDKPINSFEELRSLIQALPSDTAASIYFYRQGKQLNVSLTPLVVEEKGVTSKRMGLFSGAMIKPARYVESERLGFFTSIAMGLERTYESTVTTISGFVRLIGGEASFKSVGGPLAIGKVATDSFKISLSYFMALMALVSVNLGVINLFPVPVLDGGHILFLGLELINGKPLSQKTLELAYRGGFSLLLLLILAALYNDFARILNF